MRETLLITSESEAATTAVLESDICLRIGRSGSLSSGTTLCRVSFAVFLLRMEEKDEKSRATQVGLYLEHFGGPRFEHVPPQRQTTNLICNRVVVPW